jgi:hypothetical protein
MEIELVTPKDLEILKSEIIAEIKKILKPEKSSSGKKWLKSAEVQKLLTISAGTLQNLRNKGEIPFTKLGGVIYYDIHEINKLLENSREKFRI